MRDKALEEACALRWSAASSSSPLICSMLEVPAREAKGRCFTTEVMRQQGERAVQGRNERYAEELSAELGEHGQVNAAERHGRDQVRDEHQLLHQLAVRACRGPWRRYSRCI